MNLVAYKATYVAFLITSISVTLTRAYTRQRINKGLHTEDWLAIASCTVLVVQVILSILFLERYTLLVDAPKTVEWLGLLRPDPTTYTKKMLEYQISSHVGFLTALWLIKYSFLFFYKRLAEGRTLSKLWIFTITFCTLAYVGNLIGYFFVCIPLSSYFDTTCQSESGRSNASLYGATATDIISDLLIMAIPLRLIRQLRMSVFQKLGLIFLFCLGVIVIAMSAIRAVRINAGGPGDYKQSDPRWVALWSIAEETTAILVCCLPAIRKLFSFHRARRISDDELVTSDCVPRRSYFRIWSKYGSKSDASSTTCVGTTRDSAKLESIITFPSPPVSPRKPEPSLSRAFATKQEFRSENLEIDLLGVIPPISTTVTSLSPRPARHFSLSAPL